MNDSNKGVLLGSWVLGSYVECCCVSSSECNWVVMEVSMAASVVSVWTECLGGRGDG